MLCWLHHCTYRSREANAERSQVYHSERQNLMSISFQDPISTGKPVAVFSSRNKMNHEKFSDREDFYFKTRTSFWGQRTFLQILLPGKCCEILLDGNRDHLLADARSELMKQEFSKHLHW